MRWLVSLTVAMLFSSGAVAWAADAQGATAELEQAYPGVRFYDQFGQLTCVYGVPFGFGTSPYQTAESFVQAHSEVFGVAPGDLVEGNRFNGLTSQPLMFDRDTGEHKFTLIYYSQYKDGLPVYEAELRLLARNVSGCPLVQATSSLRDLGSFTVPPGAAKDVAEEAAHAAARAAHPGLVNFGPFELVVWAGYDDTSATPTVAITFVGDDGLEAASQLLSWHFVADAATGDILHERSLIIFEDVVGNVSGMATEGPGAQECGDEVLTAMPYASVSIQGGNSAYADESGDFVIANPGTAPVTVDSPVVGRYFRTVNAAGSSTVLSQQVTPPGPADFVHNAANTDELIRAEVNAYVQANIVRDFALAQEPTYPVIGGQTNFTVNVNRTDGYCPGNAWYSSGPPSSINFCRSSSTYTNTAYSSVVHHEYGHHLVACSKSGQGQYGEGMSDCMSMLLSDQPLLGIGFYKNNCTSGIRTAVNNLQYPCGGAIHYCGQLLSGCVWDTRNELKVNYPSTYLDIISKLTVCSILLHTGTEITDQITIDFLTLDDDDGNLANGTPHYCEIANGFGAHNMPAPLLLLLEFNYPGGLPEVVHPDGGEKIRVEVSALMLQPKPDTGMFHYKVVGGNWVSEPMQVVSPNVYDAVLPAVTCGESISFYFSAEATTGETVGDPQCAPGSSYSALSALEIVELYHFNFETSPGWSAENLGATSGDWERGVPVNDPSWQYDPISDSDGSGQCWLTENRLGNTDVDNGAVRLMSSEFDMSMGHVTITYDYYLFLTNTSGGVDRLLVEISSNGTAGPWIEIARHTSSGSLDWRTHAIDQAALNAAGVTMTSTMQLRWTANDANPQSINESALDALYITAARCEPQFKLGDMNCDGSVNFDDIDPFVLALSGQAAYQAQYPNCRWLNADCNKDGKVDFDDIDPFVALLGG